MQGSTTHLRYQVLWDNRTRSEPHAEHGIVNCRTRRQADTEAKRLRAEGKHKVSVWDTLDNPLSNMFRL